MVATGSAPGWLELAWFADVLVSLLLLVVHESLATARCGRTIGKSVLGIRPLEIDGGPFGPGRAMGRAGLHALSGFFGILALLDFPWCLWDDNRKCVHEKIVGTIVIPDR